MGDAEATQQIWGRKPFLWPNRNPPPPPLPGTADTPSLFSFDRSFKHLTCGHLFLDVLSLFICHPQNESPEPSTLILKSG